MIENLNLVRKLVSFSSGYYHAEVSKLVKWLETRKDIKRSNLYDKSWLVIEKTTDNKTLVSFSAAYFQYLIELANLELLSFNDIRGLLRCRAMLIHACSDFRFLSQDQAWRLFEKVSPKSVLAGDIDVGMAGLFDNVFEDMSCGAALPKNILEAFCSDEDGVLPVWVLWKLLHEGQFKAKYATALTNERMFGVPLPNVKCFLLARLFLNSEWRDADILDQNGAALEGEKAYEVFEKTLMGLKLSKSNIETIIKVIINDEYRFEDAEFDTWQFDDFSKGTRRFLYFVRKHHNDLWLKWRPKIVEEMRYQAQEYFDEGSGRQISEENLDIACDPFLSVEALAHYINTQKTVFYRGFVASFYVNAKEASDKAWIDAYRAKTFDHSAEDVKLRNATLEGSGTVNFKQIKAQLMSLLGIADKHVDPYFHLQVSTAFGAFESILDSSGFRVAIMEKIGKLADLPEFVKIGVIVNSIHSAMLLKTESSQDVLQRTLTEVKGWYDLSKILPRALQWKLYCERRAKKEILAHEFLNYRVFGSNAKTCLHSLARFSPYDARGGFNAHTYERLCKLIGSQLMFEPIRNAQAVWQQVNQWRSNSTAACNLAYLYGSDFEAAKAAILVTFKNKYGYQNDFEQTKQIVEKYFEENLQNEDSWNSFYKNHKAIALMLRTAVHDLGNTGSIQDIGVDAIKHYRPMLIKHPSLLMAMGQLRRLPVVENESLASLKERIFALSYDNVPKELAPHMEHALINGWDQQVVDEFVEIVTKQTRKEHYIPQVSVKTDNCVARILDPKDPKALYIGELSGCCQHINEGAGNDAAIQSYTEPWCGVLVFESPESGKLLAQSFVWLNKSRSSIVLDSIESVFDEGDTIITSAIEPALVEWAKKVKLEHAKNVGIGDTDYGITSELFARFADNQSDALKQSGLKVKSYMAHARAVTPAKELLYTDVCDEILILS